MSFIDQGRRVRPTSVAIVVLVHVAIGYAVVSGLAYTVFVHKPPVTKVDLIPDDSTPPPPRVDLPRSTAHPTPLSQPVKVDPIVPTTTGPIVVSQIPEDIVPKFLPQLPRTDPPIAPDLGRTASTVGDRAAWVTTDDYPASAARAGATGTTGIRVTVGLDGRASDCRVTASSGNPVLDDTACRTYLRRARFRPALDRDGHAIVSDHADRIKWVLPTE